MIQHNIPLNNVLRFTLEFLDILELRNQCLLMEDYEKAAHCRDRERELYDSTPNKIIEAFNADLQFIANNTASSVDISSRTASITHSDKNLVNVRNLLLYYQTLRTNKINQILKNNE